MIPYQEPKHKKQDIKNQTLHQELSNAQPTYYGNKEMNKNK